MPRVTHAEQIAEFTKALDNATGVINKLLAENERLRDALADKSFPAETLIETLEQTILKATKVCSDSLRGLKGGA